MKRMKKGASRYPDEGRYRIVDDGECFTIFLASDEYGIFAIYEYDKACGTRKEVEEELRKYNFHDIVERYHERWVYCESVERM